MFCDFPTLSRICIFFLLTLSLLIFSLLIFLFSLPLPCSAFHLSILSEVWLLNFLRQLACAWFQVVAWLPSVWVHYLLRGVKFQHPWTKWIEPKLGSKVTRNARTSTNLKSVAAFALEFSGGTSKRLASVNQKTLQIRVWGVHESRHLLQDHAGESEELLIMAQIKTEDQRILFFHQIWDFLTMKIRTYSGHITVYIYPIFIKISIKIRTS